LLVVSATPAAVLADLAGLDPAGLERGGLEQGGLEQGGKRRTGGPNPDGPGADRPSGPRIDVVSDPPADGLNPAVAHAADRAARSWPDDAVAVVVADLAALTAAAFDTVLARAAETEVGIVVDRQGMGTTMLTALPGHSLHPRFGAGSARRHLEHGAARISAPVAARTDVDVLDDLEAAHRLGFGPAMSALLAAGELPALPGGRRD
jgi:2-phospho-L-lactate guanylyltransferase